MKIKLFFAVYPIQKKFFLIFYKQQEMYAQ